jgi:succinate dehydrogenase / fumarate reductase flavoprotein subunit
MQGLADGYFVIPYAIGDYLATRTYSKVSTDHPEFLKAEKNVKDQIQKILSINGTSTVDEIHKELGKIMWDYCGMSRTAQGLQEAKEKIQAVKQQFWNDVKVLGTNEELNMSLEKAGRVADFIELGALMIDDALHRKESCGGHFREEYQTEEGEALRDDENFTYVASWEYQGEESPEILNKEHLEFDSVKLTQRSYK